MAMSIISGAITGTITLGAGNYVPDLTIAPSMADLFSAMPAWSISANWMGIERRAYDSAALKGNHLALPLKIHRHALEFDVLPRDLFVSPGHAFEIPRPLD